MKAQEPEGRFYWLSAGSGRVSFMASTGHRWLVVGCPMQGRAEGLGPGRRPLYCRLGGPSRGGKRGALGFALVVASMGHRGFVVAGEVAAVLRSRVSSTGPGNLRALMGLGTCRSE